jgi:hypothetical protein
LWASVFMCMWHFVLLLCIIDWHHWLTPTNWSQEPLPPHFLTYLYLCCKYISYLYI